MWWRERTGGQETRGKVTNSLSQLTSDSLSLMSNHDSPTTSPTHRRRSTTPAPNAKKRVLLPHKAAKRIVLPPESKEGCSDDGHEYISIVDSESESEDLDLDLEQPAKPLPKGPVWRTRTAPDDGLTPRRRARRKHYHGYGFFTFTSSTHQLSTAIRKWSKGRREFACGYFAPIANLNLHRRMAQPKVLRARLARRRGRPHRR